MGKLCSALTIVLFTSSYLNADSIKSEAVVENCEDYAFRQVELYYDHGNTDNFEAGQLFYTALWLCEKVKA
ncbi:hypothetical protein [Yeosuana sp. AK3]